MRNYIYKYNIIYEVSPDVYRNVQINNGVIKLVDKNVSFFNSTQEAVDSVLKASNIHEFNDDSFQIVTLGASVS